MANNIIKRVWNQGSMTPIEDLQGSAFTNENGGHTFQISGVDSNGEALALSGTVAASFLRPDQTTVGISGSVSGGVASVTLSEECYGIPGRFGLVIFLTSDGKKTAIYSCVGNVARSSTDAIAPGVVADVVDLINEIQIAVDTIPASYSALMADIAPTYSSSALYAVGDYAWYEGDLKRCIVPITVGETYTPAHWTSAVVGDDVCALKSATNDSLNYLSTNGLNLFNPARSKDNAYINASGNEVSKSNFSHSDMIPVKANTTVYISRGLGSNSYPTLLQFDASGDLLSNGTKTQSRTDAFSFTTESTAAYLVYNYATAQAGNIMISYTDTAYEAFKLIGSGNVTKYSISSPNIIFYDGTNLLSKSNIRLFTNKKIIEFTPPVNVGSGAYLYFNAETETLFASSNMETGINQYLICALNGNEYHKNNVFSSFINKFPIEYDPMNRTVTIIKGNGIIYHQGTYYNAGSGSVTLTSEAEHFILYYSVSDSSFHVTGSYSNLNNDDIVIMDATNGVYSSLSPVKIVNGQFAKSGVSFYTFGDSLTWYDGNDFTWGPHEGETCVGYQSYLQKINRMILETNYGQSGKTTPQICARLISNVSNISDNSFVFLMGGDNDDRLDVDVGSLHAVGSSFDDTTVYGALQKAVETLLASKPTVRLILMTEPIGWTSKNGVMYRVDSDIPDAYRNVAKLYGLPLIDLWNVAGVNEFTRATYFCDPLPVSEGGTNRSYMYHPNNDGWKRIATYICDEVLKL